MTRDHSTITRVIQELIDIKLLRNPRHLEMPNSSSDPVDAILMMLSVFARISNILEKFHNLIVTDFKRNLADHQLAQQAVVLRRLVLSDGSELPVSFWLGLVATDWF